MEEVLLVAGVGGTASLTPRPPPRWRPVCGPSLPFYFPQSYSLDGGHILSQVGGHTPLRTLSAFLLRSTPAVKCCSLPSAIAPLPKSRASVRLTSSGWTKRSLLVSEITECQTEGITICYITVLAVSKCGLQHTTTAM